MSIKEIRLADYNTGNGRKLCRKWEKAKDEEIEYDRQIRQMAGHKLDWAIADRLPGG